MRIQLAVSAGLVVLATGAAAHANLVNVGNLTALSTPQTVNISGIVGGPYNTFTFTTNWTYGSGSATSNGAAFNFKVGSLTSLISSLSFVSGMAPNGNPTTITVTGRLSINVNASTALQLLYGQNVLTLGSHSASWANTTVNFTYTPPVVPPPVAVVALGPRGNTASAFSVSTGGSTLNPVVGLYSELGNLLASNVPGTTEDPGLTGIFLPEGTYYLFVAGAGATLGLEGFDAHALAGAAGGQLGGSVGDGGWMESAFGEGEGRWYQFSIVPAPGTALLTGLGLLAGARRRRGAA